MKAMINSNKYGLIQLFFSFLFLFSSEFIFGQQQTFVYHSGEIEVSGYTNNYNWKMKTDSVECKALITLQNRQLKAINNLNFTVPVQKLSSPNTYMDLIATVIKDEF